MNIHFNAVALEPSRAVRRALLAGLLTMAVAARAFGQAVPVDVDGDGVADEIDACRSTPPGDLVAPDGCSVCPCEWRSDETEWASRKEYVGCVVAEASRRRDEGLMSSKEMRRAVRAARRATCGNDDLVRCCIYANDDDSVGRCRIATERRCDVLFDRTDGLAWEEDIGSCLPNPCAD